MASFSLEDWSNLGNVLVRRGVITKMQLQRAIYEQRKRRKTKLGELLVELRLCSPCDIEDALREQDSQRIPEPSVELHAAQELLANAFAKVTRQVDRVTERSRRGTLELAISPDEV